MNKILLFAVTLILGIVLVPAALAFMFENHLCRRFPNLSRAEIREVYAQYLTNCSNGMYGDPEYIDLHRTYVILEQLVFERTIPN